MEKTRFSSSSNNTKYDHTPRVTLDFHHDDSIAILTLSNPRRRNALTYSMMEQLDDHVTTLETWSKVGTALSTCNGVGSREVLNGSRAIILTGSHDHFCSGLDLYDHAQTNHLLQPGPQMNLHMTQVTNRLYSLSVPSIAAVDGNAIGGGAELTTCTDFVVLAYNARVQFVHAKRGASPGWGGGRRLVNKVGRRMALQMLLLDKYIRGSEEAKSLCYADGVGNEEESALDASMRLIVKPILELPCPKAIRAIKSVVCAADGDRDVIDVEKKTLLYDSNKALVAEREAFVSVWGGDSNLKQIKEAKDKLREKKIES